jgi:signal transduction histidine kinase
MMIITYFLAIILLIAVIYIIYLEYNIKQIKNDLLKKVHMDTNTIITSSTGNKNICNLVNEINIMIKYFRESKIEIERKNRNLNCAITNISHDLRTPLTSALGYVELLQNSDLSETEKQKYEKIIENKLLRLSNLINDFFEFSKIVSGNEKIRTSKVNVTNILENSVVSYYDDYNSQKRKIILNISDNLSINSNINLLTRIFDNLIINALKHGEGDLTINVKNKKSLILEFSNNIVYKDVDTNKIFDEFYTSDISRTKGNTGLGLAIVKEFVHLLGGKVYAKLKNNKLTITIELKNT